MCERVTPVLRQSAFFVTRILDLYTVVHARSRRGPSARPRARASHFPGAHNTEIRAGAAGSEDGKDA